jgi:pimeloyl-ACP methyl ester carboxylesterase
VSAIDEGDGPAILVVHPGGGDATSLPHVERIVTLPDQGHIAHLTAPDLLADVIRAVARQRQLALVFPGW